MIRFFMAAALLLGAAILQAAAPTTAELDPNSRIVQNASEIRDYQIEGVSLNTSPGRIESILLGRGYRRVHPVEPPKLGHTDFIYVKGNAVTAGPAGGLPGFSGQDGYGYEVMVILAPIQSWYQWPMGGEKMYVAQLRYRRLPPLREAAWRGNARMFTVTGLLPDSPDKKVLTDFRAIHCARNLDDQLHLGPSPINVRDGSHAMQISLRAVRDKSELKLTHGPA
jgi:hypothetical protein